MAKKSFKPDYNACIGNNKHENFGSIYESMVKSEQFKALSNPARMLYVLCRIQHKSSAGKACLHNHSEEFGVKYPDSCFVFPAKQQLEYGFIEKYESNEHRKKVNVYRFVSNWKN